MKYLFGTNINNTGKSGIIELDSRKIICLCDKENSTVLLQALKHSKLKDEDKREPIENALYSIENKKTPEEMAKDAEKELKENPKIENQIKKDIENHKKKYHKK